MNIMYLIVIYGIICICMIIFNICAIIYEKGNNKVNVAKTNFYKEKIKEQLDRLSEGKIVDKDHLKFLKKKLKTGNELIIFDSIINRYKIHEPVLITKYLNECKTILLDLIYHYNKKTNTEMAYYLSLIRDYNLLANNSSVEMEKILFQTLLDENFYCRDNAYLAICKLGSPIKLYKALLIINNTPKFYHSTLIFNGLSIYNGDKDELIKLLMKNFNKFQTEIKCRIIEYLSYNNTDYNAFIYSLLLENNARSLKKSAIKYFEIVYYKDAEKKLITYVNKYLGSNLGDLDFCLSCVKALRNYVSDESISTIKKAIYSDEIKIRNIACESLAVIRLGIDPSDLEEFSLEEEVNDMYNYYIRKNINKVVK